jgi:hypothetical protein
MAPSEGKVRALWRARHGNTPSPLLLVVLYADGTATRAAVCGPAGSDPTVRTGLDPSQVERLAQIALDEPDRHAAIRFLADSLTQAETNLPGLRNVGMFASHELREGVPGRPDWPRLVEAGRPLLTKRGRELVEALGFEVEARGIATQVLRVREGQRRIAVAVFLERGEQADAPSARFQDASPVSHALSRADQENLDFVVLTQGPTIRIYSARRHAGVGRRGRADTFVEANLALLPDHAAGYLPLIFSASALVEDGTFEELLRHSRDFAAALGERLRDRVYDEVVPRLAQAIGQAYAKAHRRSLSDADLPHVHEMAMRVLFRLLFISYAEDKGLLPYETSGEYRRHALKTRARSFADRLNEGWLAFDEHATDLWSDVLHLFDAIDHGNTDWGVPPYNGGLFASDPERSPVGADIARLSLTNAEFGPALAALLVDRTSEDDIYGPVDFRALSVREFGTIYEGLLESSLALARTDLTIDRKGRYVPAKRNEPVRVPAGMVYLQNESGARKATGSYFTKQFAVERLLERSLDPALDDHLARIRALIKNGELADAARMFFTFRCADLAMGSGHFLVAAIDHIEARMTRLLAEHPLPNVQAELDRLRGAAKAALGDLGEGVEIETSSLLRRQIARRCIYGCDINEIAVELARLAVWIHTFVPGLPLSFLNHNLIHGNSLTGIGAIREAVELLDPESQGEEISIWKSTIDDWIADASAALARLGRIADATAAEVAEAYGAQKEAASKVEPARVLFDMLVAHRLGEVDLPDLTHRDITAHRQAKAATRVIAPLLPVHFPLRFPEVFSGEAPGFHCIVGNPPWEEATLEEPKFWTRYEPGLMSLPQADQKRRIRALQRAHPDLQRLYERELEDVERVRRALVSGPFPGMGTGDPDLYKAFLWRFWDLLRPHGAIGVVLPRSALMTKGSAEWRRTVLQGGRFDDVVLMVNRGGWVFDDAEHRYTIALVSICKGDEHGVRLQGPFHSLKEFRAGIDRSIATFSAKAFLGISEDAVFPLLPSVKAGRIFQQMLSHPRLDSDRGGWRVRPVAELHATNDKDVMDFTPSTTRGKWPVYKGASFTIWRPDTGEYYAWATPKKVCDCLQQKRLRQQRLARSAFSAFPRSWALDHKTLPCLRPRIAFRDVARATDSRTVIAALVPPSVVLANQAPYLLLTSGDERDEAYLLGVLCSLPLDWYARRLVETHLNFHILNGLPVPRPEPSDPRRRRVIEIAGRLAAVDDRYDSWAAAVGVPIGTVDDAMRDDLVSELDALAAHLYGLSADQLRVIFETFHEGWDFHARCERTLHHYQAIAS